MDGRVERVLEDAVRGREEIQAPQREHLERLDVLLDLVLGHAKVVGRLDHHVPSDRLKVVDQVPAARRDPATFVWPGTGVGGEHVEGVAVRLQLVRDRARVDDRLPAEAEVEEVGHLEGERRPRARVAVKVDAGHDRVGVGRQVLLRDGEAAAVPGGPVRPHDLVGTQRPFVEPAHHDAVEVLAELPRLPQVRPGLRGRHLESARVQGQQAREPAGRDAPEVEQRVLVGETALARLLEDVEPVVHHHRRRAYLLPVQPRRDDGVELVIVRPLAPVLVLALAEGCVGDLGVWDPPVQLLATTFRRRTPGNARDQVAKVELGSQELVVEPSASPILEAEVAKVLALEDGPAADEALVVVLDVLAAELAEHAPSPEGEAACLTLEEPSADGAGSLGVDVVVLELVHERLGLVLLAP